MTKPTRETIEGRVYLDIRAKAKADGRATDELLQLYALECFVARLASSTQAKHFVLKGGVLLAAYDLRRPTRDVDLLAQGVNGERDAVLARVNDVLLVRLDDGCIYGEPTAEAIREDDEYQGVRVHVPCTLAGAKLGFHVDISIGDPVVPSAETVRVARLLGGDIAVRGYPLSMVLAEKIVTAMQRGTANTRWRDFADIYLLLTNHEITADELMQSMRKVATHRQAEMKPLAATLKDYAGLGQAKWLAWTRKQHLDDRLPAQFADVLALIQAFADTIIDQSVTGKRWDPRNRQWV